MSPLTAKQDRVLFVVAEHGPIAAREVSRHLLIDSPYSVLSTLEKRGLVEADYTSLAHRYRAGVRAYTVTERGRAALDAADREED